MKGLIIRLMQTTLIVAIAAMPLTAAKESLAEEKRQPLQIEGKSALPLRVLSRAFSTIYKSPSTTQGTVEENVPAFQSFFVYGISTPGGDLATTSWYEVGSDNRGTVVGWMNSDDVFEWKQTMCLAYTHPEGRHPVLMFDKKNGLKQYLDMPGEQRNTGILKLYSEVESGAAIPANFPVVTMEPKKAVDIAKEFYLLPILDFEEIELNNREARLLKLAAVTGSGEKARESSDIRKNQQYLQSATEESGVVNVEKLKKLGVDIVWVMDTTNSMGPYIEQTLKVVEGVSNKILADQALTDSVRFGIWGYRDAQEIPGIGYTTYNYTPELEDIRSFIQTLKKVKVTPSGSQGYAEDVFAGVAGALDKTAWNSDSLSLIILVGDAPSHEPGHVWNSTGQSHDTLRAIASDRNVTIFSLHIKDPQAIDYHELAEEQFQVLSTNAGTGGEPTYFSTASDDLVGFEAATLGVTETIIGLLEEKNSFIKTDTSKQMAGNAALTNKPEVTTTALTNTTASQVGPARNLDLFGDAPSISANEENEPSAKKLAQTAIKAAMVEWIGSQSGAMAPRDVVGWSTDKDLLNTDIQALEVRLLINKTQLDSLRTTLNAILLAGRSGQISGEDFFSSLQAAAASTARDPNMIMNAKSLAQTGLIPEFLQGLPYTSRIMDMNNELWNSWSIDEQDMFLADLEARIFAYEVIHDGPEGWVQLNKNDDPGDYVYPITLDLLP